MSNGQGIGLNNMQAAWFSGRTGTDSSENIPHNMGVTPAIVLLMVRDSAKTYTVGTSTNVNIVVTVENGATYDVVALFDRQ